MRCDVLRRPVPNTHHLERPTKGVCQPLIAVQIVERGLITDNGELGLQSLKLAGQDADAPDDAPFRHRGVGLTPEVRKMQRDDVFTSAHPRATTVDAGQQGGAVGDPGTLPARAPLDLGTVGG